MITFGIDPGSRKTGWGAVRSEGSRLIALGFGTIKVSPKLPLAERLAVIHAGLRGELIRLGPDQVVLESIFHSKSAKSALVLGHARGVALLAAAMTEVPVLELSPTEVKKAVSGSGRSDKHQVQHMVKALLGLGEVAEEDASDALAVAIAGSARRRFSEVAAAGSRR